MEGAPAPDDQHEPTPHDTDGLGKPKLTDAMVYMATMAMLQDAVGVTGKEADRMWREWKDTHWKN